MKRNEDCIRSIMIYLEENLTPSKKIKGMDLYSVLPIYSKEDIDESITIILERKLVEKKNEDKCSPRATNFARITDKGHDYLDVVRNDTIWNSLKEKFKGFLTPENVVPFFQAFLKSNGIL